MATATMESSEAPPAAVPAEESPGLREWAWRVSCHEGAHVLAAQKIAERSGTALRGTSAMVVADGGGVMATTKGFSLHEKATYARAGHFGEMLSRRHPAPCDPLPPPITAESTPVGIPTEILQEATAKFDVADDDGSVIRRFCCERGGPNVWMSRWRTIDAEARDIVFGNENTVLCLASELFRSGSLPWETIERILAGALPAPGRADPGERTRHDRERSEERATASRPRRDR
jgi:hypothetical protein